MNELFPNYSDEEARRIAGLIAGFIRGTLSRDEQFELDAWVCENDENMELFERLTDDRNIASATQWMQDINTERALLEKKQRMAFNPPARKKRVWPYALAAAVILLAGLFYFKPFSVKKASPESGLAVVEDLQPGTDSAVLTLEDGSIIKLSSKGNDTLIQKTAQLRKADGELIYAQPPTSQPLAFHTLAVPRKSQYKLTLPDGTRVWLNAESSIHYPVSFSDTERKVFVTGETYFEVASDKAKPFRVVFTQHTSDTGSKERMVEALGTKFNINAYSNEPNAQATLVEGSIRVSNGRSAQMLKPGQQALVEQDKIKLASVNTADVIAWKDHVFKFSDAPLDLIMRQVERWYDAEIVYENHPTDHFNAEMSRAEPVSKLLHNLEMTNRVHFTIQQNSEKGTAGKITVRK